MKQEQDSTEKAMIKYQIRNTLLKNKIEEMMCIKN